MTFLKLLLAVFIAAPTLAFAEDCAPGETRALINGDTTSFNGVQISVSNWSGLQEVYGRAPLTRAFEVRHGQVTLNSNVPALAGAYTIENGALYNNEDAFCGASPVNLQCLKVKYDPAMHAVTMDCSIAVYTNVAKEP
ncbi:MAG: hypothetical protein H7X92_03855 [Chitinophagales bacterium]|nr:hypothetical protein [Hyphomicrobiales bacterium]